MLIEINGLILASENKEVYSRVDMKLFKFQIRIYWGIFRKYGV